MDHIVYVMYTLEYSTSRNLQQIAKLKVSGSNSCSVLAMMCVVKMPVF